MRRRKFLQGVWTAIFLVAIFTLLEGLDLTGMESREQIETHLAAYSYDPTNGLASPGDIFRVKQ